MTEEGSRESASLKKEKKDRDGPRTRRRLRKSYPAVGTDAPQTPRWIKVSKSNPPGSRDERPHLERLEGSTTPSEHSTRSGKGGNALSSSQGIPALPSTPSQHLLPLSLLSPATSSGTPGKFPAQRRLPIVVSDSQCSGNPASSKATSKARNGGSGYQSEDLPPTNGFHVSHCWVPGRDIGGGAGGRPATSVRENRAPSDTPLDSTCDGNVAAESVNPSSGVAERRAIVRHSSEQGDSERWAAFGPPAAFWRPVPKPDSGTCGAEQGFVLDGGALWNNLPMHDGDALLSDESEREVVERRRWQEWAKHATEHERQRRIKVLESMDREEHRERLARRAWALSAMDEEQRRRAGQQGTNWFQGTICSVDLDYEIVCPYSSLGCRHICLRTELDEHLVKDCRFNKEPQDSDSDPQVAASEYEVVCPNTILGCDHSCSRNSLNQHLETCAFTGPDRTEEKAERARSLQMVLEQAEEERARRVAHDAKGDWQSDSVARKTRRFLHRLLEDQRATALVLLHKEILNLAARCREVQERRKQALENVLSRVEIVIDLLWPGASVLPFGSWASACWTPDSDVDLVVFHTGEREGRKTKGYRRGDITEPPMPQEAKFAVETKEELPFLASCAPPSTVAAGPSCDRHSPSTPGLTRQGEPPLTSGPAGRSRSTTSPANLASDGCNRSRASVSNGSWERRQGGGRADGVGMLKQIHDLADHLRQHAPFIEVVKVLDHARVPIIKAIAVSDEGGNADGDRFNIDISIDGPMHTGLATSAFVSYLADHLPNLVPLTIVLKSLLQSNGLNDPYTGGLSSYGVVLMIAFALLRRDHFPPSPAEARFVDQEYTERTHPNHNPNPPAPPAIGHGAEEFGSDEQLHSQSPAPSSRLHVATTEPGPGADDYLVPPSPGQADGCSSCFASAPEPKIQATSTRKKPTTLSGKQRGFWQCSFLGEGSSSSTGIFAGSARSRSGLNKTSRGGGRGLPYWDRPRQQQWLGSRTARAILMQDFYAGAPTAVPTARKREQPSPTTDHPDEPPTSGLSLSSTARAEPRRDGNLLLSPLVPPPPPPPLPEPVEGDAIHALMAPRSPYITSGGEPVLGELLLDFLHLFGEDFDMAQEGFSVRGGGFRFRCHDNPPHPQAGDPIVIEDPLNCMNNVGRSSFAIGQVQRAFFEALTTLKATMVRVNQDGKEVLASGSSTPKTNVGILRHICSPHAAFVAEAASS